jgi:hypothetical protein
MEAERTLPLESSMTNPHAHLRALYRQQEF